MASSIEVSILAKIEGWRELLKQIENAASKIDVGSGIGKNISKEFDVLSKLVDQFSRHLTLKITSADLIDHLLLSLSHVDEGFKAIGDTIAGVSFEDLKPEYITDGFKDLINLIKLTEQELSSGLEASFLNAVKGSDKLQETFSKLKLDPSKMNISEAGLALTSYAEKLALQVADGNKEIDSMQERLKNLRETARSMLNLSIMKMGDTTTAARETIGNTSDIGKFAINKDVIASVSRTVENALTNYADQLKSKKEEIELTLKELIDADTIDQAREKLNALSELFNNTGLRGKIHFEASDVKNFSKLLELYIPDETVISERLERIRRLLIDNGISEADLNKIMPSADKLLHNGGFDELSHKIAEALNKSKHAAENGVTAVNEEMKKLSAELNEKRSTTMKVAAERYKADRSVEEYKNLLIQILNENKDLKNRVEQLEKILHSDATKEIQKTGAGISKSSLDNLNGALNTAKMYRTELEQVQAREQMIGKILGVVQRWFSIYAAIRMAGNAVRSVISTIKELDSTITEIAIVTNMTQSLLWKQMHSYTTLARLYAASISGVYQVSLLYYQQGLGQSDVMALTELTLKMARISGLDYALATDFMTNAVRSFKMEMTEAAKVVDVYSAIAAASATDTTELASAMSKTASSAQAVGSSFENTTAMMAVMIEATRESAENIGSAMKSIISRYGEMTSDPSKLVDSEGQVMSLNRVDKALLTVGISIHDALGEFRRFDDVIMELAQSWDTIDTNTLRYIATIMAGNRQQSRFLALVSSYDRLKQLSETAMNSEDASQLQFLKTLDSVTAKTQLLETSLLTLYVGSGLEETYKGILDIANNIIKSFTNMPTILGKPIPAILKIGTTFFSVANAVTTLFGVLKHKVNLLIKTLSGDSVTLTANTELLITALLSQEIDKRIALIEKYHIYKEAREKGMAAKEAGLLALLTYAMQLLKILQGEEAQSGFMAKFGKGTRNAAIVGVVSNLVGSFVSTFASTLKEETNRGLKASMTVLGGTLLGVGLGSMFGVPGMIIGGIAGLVTSAIEGIDILIESSEERLERLLNAVDESNNKRIETTANYNNLKSELDQLKELDKTYHDSAEAKAEYYEHSNVIAELYPMLVSAYDGEGNAILNLSKAYEVLKKARGEASDAAIDNAVKSVELAEESEKEAQKKYNEAVKPLLNTWWETGIKVDTLSQAISPNKESTVLPEFIQDLIDKFPLKQQWTLKLIFATLKDNAIGIESGSTIELLLNMSNINDLLLMLDNPLILALLTDEVEQFLDEYAKGVLEWIVGSLGSFSLVINNKEAFGDLKDAQTVTEAARKSSITLLTLLQIANAKLEADYNGGVSADYLDEFSAVGSIINDKIYQLWEEAKATNNSLTFKDWINTTEVTLAYESLMNDLSLFWESITPDKLLELNTLIANRGNYNIDNFRKKFEEITGEIAGLDGLFSRDWINELFKYYQDSFNIDKLNEALNKRKEHRESKDSISLDNIIEKLNSILEQLGPDELRNLLSTYDDLEKRITAERITSDQGDLIFEQYITAFKDQSEEVLSLLFNTDIFSFSSVMDTIHKLEGEEFDSEEVLPAIDALRQIGHLIPLNLNTETLTLLDKFNEGLSDFESSVKNATKGMNFKTMSEEVNKLDLSFDSYELKDGKYYIKDYIALSNSLIEQLAGIFADLNRELDDRKLQALNSEDTIASSLGFTEDEYDKFWQEFLHDSDRLTDNVIEYYFQLKKKELNSSMGEAEKYTRDLLARSALEAGRIADFALLAMGNEVWKGLSDDDLTAIMSAVAKGDISELTAEQQEYFAQYNSLIISTYQGIQQSIASSLMSGLSNGSGRIKVTDTNKDQLLQLLNKGWLKDGNLDTGNYIEIAVEELQKNESEFMQYVLSTYDNENDKIKALKEYHANKYKLNNTINTLSKVAESNVIAYDDYINYLTSIGYTSDDLKNSETLNNIIKADGLKMNAAGNLVVDDIEAWIADLTNTLEELPENASVEERNDLKAKIANAHNLLAQALKKAVEDAVSNYDKITIDLKTALADALEVSTEKLDPYFTPNADGLTSTFDIVGFLLAIQKGNITIGEAAQQYLVSGIATLYDNALSAITNTHKLAISGTTDTAEMLKFVDSYNKKLNEKKTVQDLFKYNNVVGGFVVDPRVTQTYVLAQIQELVKAGLLKPEDILSYIKTNAAKNVDISKYLSSERTNADLETLKASLMSYYASVIAMPEEDIENYETELARWRIKVQDQANMAIDAINGGGQTAVNKMLEIDPLATSEQLLAAYEAEIAPIKAAAELADSLEVGSFVSTEQIEILRKAGFEFEGNRVIEVATDLASAYKSLYDQMVETGEATISTLNSTAAKALDAPYKGKRNGIEAISKGMLSIEEFVLTYTDAGERFGIFTGYDIEGRERYNYQLALDQLKEKGLINVDDLGQVEIVDFEGYAATRGWQDASEEYKAAYTSWVDARIAKNASNDVNIRKQLLISNAANANIGQEVNISDLGLGTDTIKFISEVERDKWILALDVSKETNEATKRAILSALKTVKSKRNIGTTTSAIVAMNVSLQAAESFAVATEHEITETDAIMQQRGYMFNQYTQEWEATAAVLHNLSADLEAARKTGTAEDVANIQAAYNKLKAEIVNLRTNAIQDIVSNYSNISEESIAAFETAFAGFGINIRDYIDTDALGNLKVNLAALNEALAKVGYDVNQLFQEEIAAIGDSYLQAISSGVSVLSSGTNNLADISKIAKDLDPNLTALDIGYYDEILKAWTIDGNVVRQYVKKQADKLKAMGIMPEDLVDKWVELNTKGIASENIDIMGFLSGDRSQDDVNKIGRALETYWELLGRSTDLAVRNAQNEINILVEGGQRAVDMAKEIKPTLTESELAEIYSSAFNRWNDTFNEIENIVVGDVVTGDLRKVLSQLNMVDSNGVVTSAFNMVNAYTAIYNLMKQTNGRTMTSLNAAYAKLLTAKDLSRIDAIDALGGAMGMSYDALGELLARYGRSLEDELNNLYYERLGNGKVRITDFTQFATDLGLDTNSEEYLSAFKQYNESLIELDRKTAKNIKDELSNLISAKAGTRLDISLLSNALGEDTINGLIHQYGGFVQDGILSLATSTDIPGMFAAIRDQIQSGENRTIQLTETELAELQDAIDGLLSNIISLISTGVSGSLNNAQAAELKSWASANGILNLDFLPTVDGLKLTEESFFNLYATLSKINKLESKKLLPDMQKMSRSYGDLLSATREYNRTLTEAANDNNANKRLGLLDLIKSYLQDPNTYKTMGQLLPTEWLIALNFYEDAYSGMLVLHAASAKKTMGVEDFYSMINTAGSLNPNFAINGMGMDELLDAAANSLLIVDGKLSVNLEKAGITAKNGMKQFSEGWLAGLENLRRTESGYLEAYTRLSKVHDAMGKLQPIDFNLFDSDSGKFTLNAIDYLNNLGTLLGQGVTDGILFNGISLSQLLLGNNPADWTKAGFKDNASISAFIKNLSQIDFNADDIVSLLEQLTSDNPMTIRMNNEHGFIAIEPTGNVIDINWDDKTVQKNIQLFIGKRLKPETIRDTIEEAYANKDSVDFNALVQARAILALASGQIDTSGFTRDNKGHWSGYYNGLLYTGNDYATLVERITKSMLASESGFLVTLDDGEPVTGTKYVNGAEITLDIREGTYSAKFGDKESGSFDTKEALNKWIAENVGGGDTESHFEIDGTDYGVYIDELTGLSYTKWVDDNGDPHWKYHGHEFTEYSAFLAYAKSLREYSKYGEVSDSKDGNTTTITIDKNASIEMEITPDSVTTTYWFKGLQLTKEAFDLYLAALNEGSFTLDTDGSMHYEHSGMTVEVEITNGEVVFKMTVDGITFEGDKASIETAINLYALGQVDSLNPSSGGSSNGVTLTYNGFKIKVNANGETEYYTPNGEKTTRAALQTLLGDKALAELGKIDRAAQVSASSIKLAESSGAEVKIDESLKATIKAAIAEIPAEINVTAETDSAVKAINALQTAIESLKDNTVTVTVIEKVSKAKGSNIPTKTPKTPPGLKPNILEEKILGAGGAQGNVALAGGRSTLMGELGPELYVTNGHYYVAGKNGAEFVDLPDDAIVFNHLQTRKLLDKGASGRGRAVTNELKAVALAKGNMNGGSAMAGSNTMETPTLKVTGLSPYKVGPVDVGTVELDKDAKNAVKSLIQDVLNKGFKNINLKDYEKLPADIAAKVDLSGSYRKFVTEYGKMIGLTVDELNKFIIQGFEKDNPLVFAKKDIFEELEFTKEGNDTFALFDNGMIEEIAAAYEWSSDLLNAFYDEAAKYYDYASGKYKVSVDTLKKEYNTDILDYAKAHDKATNSDNLNKKLLEDLQKNNENALKEYEDSMRKYDIAQDLEFLGSGLYKVTVDLMKEIADAWGIGFEELKKHATLQDDGTFNLNLKDAGIDLSEVLTESLLAEKTLESLEKANGLIVEKINKSTRKADAVADLNIIDENTFNGSLELLEEFANAFGLDLNDVMKAAIKLADGTYNVDLRLSEKLSKINLAELILPDSMVDKIHDSVTKHNANLSAKLERLERDSWGLADAFNSHILWDMYNDLYTASYSDLLAVFDAAGKKINEEWLNSLPRNSNGDYIFTGLELEQQEITFPPEVRAKILREQREQALAAEKELASNFSNIISTVMEQGADAIDWREYEDLDPKIIAMIKTDVANLSITELVEKYAKVAGKSLKETNQLIIEAAKAEELPTRGVYDLVTSSGSYDPYYELLTLSGETLADLFTALKATLTEDFRKSLQRDEKGNYQVSWTLLAEQGVILGPELERWFIEQSKARRELIATDINGILTTLMNEGAGKIDWFSYGDKLPEPVLNAIRADIEQGNMSIGEIVQKWESELDLSVGEINKLKAEAQKADEKATRGTWEIFSSSVTWDPYYKLFSASEDTLADLFTSRGLEMSDEWLDSLERTWDGKYKFSMQDLESQGIVFDEKLADAYNRYLLEQAKAREEQIHSDLSNVISTYIDLGFDAIDFRDYFDLPTETVQLIKESAELSKRDFVVRFAEAAGKTVSEMNLLYFEAWEKDIGLEATEAAKNMLYYFGGGMSGSSTDWQALLGDSVKVSELVRLGLLEYDEALNTYYSKNVEEIELLTGIDIDDDAVTDSIRTAFESIADLIITGLDGALSNTEATKLKANLKHMGLGDVELDFSLGLEGLLLSLASAISLYTLLKKIDAIQANLMFKKLRESLEKSNDKYKTMTSLLKNIYELQEKIDHAERYNPAKIKLFQEELALAKEIAAVRATSEDESFNFLDQDIPAAMNNPLNYTNNWIEAAKSMDEAWKNGKAYDFTRFYNIVHQINDVAKMTGMSLDFLGFTLDGSIDAVDAIIRHGIDKLGTDADMDFGVMFSDWGEGLEMGSQEFANGANNAIHAMALSQIKILDSLIAMFQAIVAMEEFEGADLDMNGILDFDEVFADFELGDEADTYTLLFQDAALKILKMADANKEVQAALELVKVNDVSMMEMLRDTTDGLRNVALTASEYQTAVSVFYEMLKSGDFDINNIALSLRDNLAKNHSNFKGVIETQDMVIDMSYDIAINKTKDGKYKTPGGKEYDTAVEATKAGAVEAAGIDADQVQFDPITKNAYGTIEIADTEVTVTAYGKGKKTWKVDDQEYGSEESGIRAIYDKSSKELSFEAWKIDLEITAPIKVIQDVEVSSISKELTSHLVGKTFDLIKAEYDKAKGDHTLELEFLATYGFKLDESSTSEDFEKLKEALGIESKNIEITASVKTAEGENSALMTALEGGSAEITISANTEEATQAVTTFTETVQGTPTTETITADSSQALTIAGLLLDYINGLTASISIEASDHVTSAVDAIMASLPDSHTITVYTEDATSTSNDSSTAAKGNVSGGAMAKGTRTLMGELGPELYVTDGHYYIAGRDGAEFVDLPDDAIVFNHLLTAGLLGKGSAGRGRPITNEHNAVSMATGSLGPAAASAKETLAALLQLRAMWLKLADSTIVDLAGVGGSNLSNIAGWVDEVERWYNLLQKIAQLEKDINYQEALRRKIETDRIRDGALYYKTLQDSYDNYIELANAHRELYESQLQYFNQRREELNSEDAPFSKFYTYDENALIKFKDGGYAALADLVKQYDTGELKYTPDEQYNIMLSYGLLQYGQYDSSGQEIKSSDFEDLREYRLAVVKAIWEKMDKEREEMQSLHDSIEENKTAYLEALTNGNELLLKVIDNQIQVENDVLAAIESREQAIIDELSELKELLQKETDKYIKGLNDALSKERQLYEKNNEGSELTRLERLLAILRRSGGSASLIRSLESEIDSKRQDQYFSLQEELINAVLEAADAQILRLDTLIQLMEETLGFEKAHGMLWAEVELIMAGSSNEIVSFLAMYSKDYAALSTILLQEWIREKLFEADLWTEYRSNAPDTIAEGILKGSEPVAEERYDPEEFSMEKLETDEKNPAAGSSSSSGSSRSGGLSGGGGYSAPAKQEFDWKDYDRQNQRYNETEGSKNIALGVMNQYKNNPYSLDYLDAHAAYLYYDKESKLAQSNMQHIKKGDKDYTPDYDESKTDAITLPSSDSEIRATSEAINTIKSNIETNNNTITQANAQIEAYKKAGLAEDSTEILSIKSNIKKLEEANKAGEALIKERLGWINAALGYKKGGIIDYTGLAIVHGSKEEPEAILNSKDYKLWKQSISSNVWESLERERLEIQALHDTFNSVITNSSDSSIVIEKAEVNVNVEQIANDYDAKRMGELALQEMVRIARKTGTAIIRR